MSSFPDIEYESGDMPDGPDIIVPDPSASADENESPRERYKRWRQRNPIDRSKTEKPKTPAMPRPGVLARQLEEFYTAVGMLAMPFDPYCAQAVIAAAPECAAKMEKLCKQNHTVRRMVMKWLETSVTAEVFIAHAPIILALVSHHVPGIQKSFMRGFEEAKEEEAAA